jgi:hypothetical protein
MDTSAPFGVACDNPLSADVPTAMAESSSPAYPDSGPAGSRRILLMQTIDPLGQALTFTWDAQFRLVALIPVRFRGRTEVEHQLAQHCVPLLDTH